MKYIGLIMIIFVILLVVLFVTLMYCAANGPSKINLYNCNIPTNDIKMIQRKLIEVFEDGYSRYIRISGIIDDYTYEAIVELHYRYENESDEFSMYDDEMIDYVFGKHKHDFNF